MNNYDFDLGLGSNRPRSLNDQKNQKPSFQQSRPNNTTSSSWQPKPSWTHQPAPAQPVRAGLPGGATSMAGDIFGKNWGSPAPPTSTAKSSIGIVNKNPNLFGDLVSSALGQNKGNSNVPLKNAIPVSNAYSMGNLADSLPKTGNSVKGSGNLGSSESFRTYTSGYNSSCSNSNVKSVKIGGGLGSNKDPFVSLVDFGSKPLGSINLSGKGNKKSPSGDDAFGDFQNASKSAKPGFTPNPVPTNSKSSMGLNSGSYSKMDDFPIPTPQNQPPVQSPGVDVFDSLFSSSSASVGGGPKGSEGLGSQQFAGADDWGMDSEFGGGPNPVPTDSSSSMGLNSGSYSKMDDFPIPTPQNQPPVQSPGVDVFDSLFSSSSASVGGGPKGSEGLGSQQFAGADDWGMDSEFGGGNETGGTTELEGLPPPPAGVSASAAKNKGMDNYKQGQYPDAIKWLSWAVILHEKAGDDAATMEVLSSRASCYKEVGEYKKAVADCTKVLEHDGKNVAVLVQRALLYESMEKYKLGAEDLKTVMKLDPGNRVARSTIHRLTKMAD